MLIQRKQALKLVCRYVQAGTPLIGPIHFAPKAFPIQFQTQTSLFNYHSCYDQYSGRGFATSNGEEPNGEEGKQEGTKDKKWSQSKTTQILGLIISATALGCGTLWAIKHYIANPNSPSQPAPNTLTSNEKPLASSSQKTYPSSLIFRYKNLIKIDRDTANEFFNREEELSYLKDILVDEENIKDPQMYVMMGYNKCGKTTMINHFLANHYPKDYPPYIYIHLKEVQVGSVEEFLEKLKVKILRAFGENGIDKANNNWRIKQVNLGGKFEAKILGNPVEGDVTMEVILGRMKSKEYDVKKSLIDDLKTLITDVQNKDEKGRPVLIVIDEINALKDILAPGEDKQDIKLFKSFINMLEDVTKNKKTANVLFCSTDSAVKFMFEDTGLNWYRYFRPFYIGNKHTLLITLGFMNEEQMMKYLQEKVKLEKDLATTIWNYVGGDFNIWWNVVGKPRSLRSEEDFKKTCENEMELAIAAITPTNFTIPYGTYITKEQQIILEKIYVLLKESSEKRDQKMVNYKEMRRTYGDENINELVKAGALFLIQGDYISQDRTIAKRTPVLVANCPIHQIAIDEYVEDMMREDKEKAEIQRNKKVQKEDPEKGI